MDIVHLLCDVKISKAFEQLLLLGFERQARGFYLLFTTVFNKSHYSILFVLTEWCIES